VEAPGELQELAIAAARMVAEPPDERDHPAPALDRKEHPEARPRRRRVDHEAEPVAGPLGAAIEAARVADIDPDLGLPWCGDADLLEPLRHARATPTGVDEEIRGQLARVLHAVSRQADAADPALVNQQAGDAAPVQHADVRKPGDAGAAPPPPGGAGPGETGAGPPTNTT